MARTIDLAGHTALVTGDTRNIGQGIALALAQAGADVAVIGRSDQTKLDETLTLLEAEGVNAHGQLVDVADWDALRAGLAQIEAVLGMADIVVNNVAVRPQMVLEEVTAEDWDQVFRINVRAGFQTVQWALPHMMRRRWGRVINVSGQDALAGSYGRLATTTSKGAVIGFTAALAPTAAAAGVIVNTLVPGTIDTHRHTTEWYPNTEELLRQAGSRTLVGRLGRIDEVANVALFLASDLASFYTGQTVSVGGGFPLQRRKEMEDALGLTELRQAGSEPNWSLSQRNPSKTREIAAVSRSPRPWAPAAV
jgi:3-oxoacyl-[acyl-carrier protein] reductase